MAQTLIDAVIDFETYYDSEYSLTKMTTAEYIYDPRFRVIGFGILIPSCEPIWVTGSEQRIRTMVTTLPWHRIRCIAHNAIFDGGILEFIYGVRPAKYLCTMMGSRPHVLPFSGGTSLRVLMQYLNFGAKGVEVDNHRGRKYEEFTSEQLAKYGEYCKNDVVGCARIAKYIEPLLPEDELNLIDLTIKKFTRPALVLDASEIEKRRAEITFNKIGAVARVAHLGVSEATLRSRPKFVKILEAQGVIVPTKVSKTTGKSTHALAKNDEEFVGLRAHQNEAIRNLVEARLLLSSSIEESRLARFQQLYDVVPDHMLPVPLLYYGAHPGRYSGLDKINLQNLPRVKKRVTGSGLLRRCITAPEGYKIIAADLKNIEARLVATLAGQQSLVDAFAKDTDVYSDFASRIYNRKITKQQDELERFVGKTSILGLGYGMGHVKFLATLTTAETPVAMAEQMAKRIVYMYRETYAKIPALWKHFDNAIANVLTNPQGLVVWKGLSFCHERIILPNGMPLMYPGLQIFRDSYGVSSGYGYKLAEDNRFSNLWGGIVTENICQALARIIMTDAELLLARHGLFSVLQVHDELVYCVRNEYVDAAKKAIAKAMTVTKPWLPNLPIAVEIGVGQNYGEAK